MPRTRLVAFLIVALALPLGCGGDPPTAPVAPPSGPVKIAASFYPSGIFPGQETILTVTVAAPDGQAVTEAKVVFSGLLNDTVLLPTPNPGNFGYTIRITTTTGPFEGRIDAMGVARLGSSADTARTSLTIIDDGPPHFDNLFFHVFPSPGDTMNVAFVAKDVAGIAQMSYHIHGALDISDGNTYPLPPEIAVQVLRFIPRSVQLGDSVIVDVSVWDGFGKKTTSTIRTVVADFRAPDLTATLSPGPYDSLLPWRRSARFVGDTIVATYQVRDFKVAWVGWQIPDLGLGDSVAVGDTAYAGTLRVPVTARMDGPGRLFTIFARDSSQNRAVKSVLLDFVDATRRAFQVAGPGFAGEPPDAVVSPQRGVVLIVGGGLKVVTIAPFASFGNVPGLIYSFAVDIAPGGDSAWVADGNGSKLDELRLDPMPVAIVDSSMFMHVPYAAQALRITTDRRALFSGDLGPTRDPGIVTFVNLVTGVHSNQSVTGFPNRVTSSQDRSLFVGFDGSGHVMTYAPATNQFGPAKFIAAGRPSVDAFGSLVLVHNVLYDGALNYLRTLGPLAFASASSIISADGQYGYFAVWPGYQKVRISDGAVVEKVFVPNVDFLMEIPGQDRLLVFGQPVFSLVDLSPGGVVPAARY
jgi:hypothetical protein